MALIFRPNRRVDEISFYDAFRDLKRGREAPLAKCVADFFDKLGAAETAWRRRYTAGEGDSNE